MPRSQLHGLKLEYRCRRCGQVFDMIQTQWPPEVKRGHPWFTSMATSPTNPHVCPNNGLGEGDYIGVRREELDKLEEWNKTVAIELDQNLQGWRHRIRWWQFWRWCKSDSQARAYRK